MISVLIASSSAVVRAGLESLVASSPALRVAGISVEGPELAGKIDELQPDVVLFDSSSREEDLLVALQGLGNAHPAALVLLSDNVSSRYLQAGARAILPHNASAIEIAGAIQAAAAGLIAFHPDALETFGESGPGPSSTPPSERLLTAREIEVLRMLSEGLANKEVAWRLGISEHTVKFHVASLFAKLNASSRTEAVRNGVRLGLIML